MINQGIFHIIIIEVGKMKVVQKGKNIYKKANWFQENEKEIYSVGIAILALINFILINLIRG